MSMSSFSSSPQPPLKDAPAPGSRSHAPPTSRAASSSTRADKPSPAPVKAATPAVRTFFDPWNSSSTGHQRAENRLSGSTSWRASRNLKLGSQFKGGLTGGGKRLADTVGAGSEHFGKDGRKENGGWENGAKGLRTGGQQSLAETWGASKPGKRSSFDREKDAKDGLSEGTWPHSDATGQETALAAPDDDDHTEATVEPSEKQIFAGLRFYINGSTAPLVSDHKLKQLLAIHGANHSIALGRRTVTHVILGSANSNGGAGGGLASSKIQKEIARSGGKAVKFVTADWVLDSIKANRRLAESQYSPLKLAPKTQTSVFGVMRTANLAKSNQERG